MYNRQNPLKFTLLLAVLMLFTLLPTNVNAEYRIELTIGDAVGDPNETDIRLPIYLSNPLDTVKAFQIWLQLDRPDIATFNMSYDLTGTLLDGIVTTVSVNSLSGLYYDALVTGGSLTPGTHILPQTGPTPLLYLLLDMEDVPDSEIDRVADIFMNTDFLDHFSFANLQGESIGISSDTITRTECWSCTAWAGEVCLNWVRVQDPPCDSTYDYLDTLSYVDTSQVHVTNGTITATSPFICGDSNTDDDVNISDLTFIVDFMFRGGSAPVHILAMDCDGDGEFDISDLTCFVCYLFGGCGPPICTGL